jgi:uncharacterized protein (TIGR01777 family)
MQVSTMRVIMSESSRTTRTVRPGGVPVSGGRIVVERSTRLPFTPEQVWAWHVRPGAFERLTPPWERARVLERPIALENGSRVVLEVHAGPVPLRWVALHRDVTPGRGFIDEQVEGPFAHWVHEHLFTPERDGCMVTDRITCSPPLGAVGGWFGGPFVRAKLERMLRYRHAVLGTDLEMHARAGLSPLHIAVTGASGLVGSALVPFLTTGGHRVTRLVRRSPAAGEVQWQPDAGRLDAAALEGIDAVVHLGGENIANGRWTTERKRLLRESRVGSTRLLAGALARLERKPGVLVSVSGTGIYGSHGNEIQVDESPPGIGFLAEMATAWEAAAAPALDAGIRVAHPRFGIVLSPAGGALAKMLPAFLAGGGGPMGGGNQWMSWSSIDDAVGMLHFAIASEAAGAFNAVSPAPVTNAQFARLLGRVLQRPAVLPVPAFALRLLFGEMAEGTLLASTRALPRRLERWGYRFIHTDLEPALRHVLGR